MRQGGGGRRRARWATGGAILGDRVEEQSSAEAAAPQGAWARYVKLMEEYGAIAIGVTLTLFAIEMVTLVALLRAGVDFGPFVAWVNNTLGWDASGVLEAAGTVGIAYAITRALKPLQIMLVLVLTPIVARVVRKQPAPPQA